jgi:ABC-type sugar transport system permease subunit
MTLIQKRFEFWAYIALATLCALTMLMQSDRAGEAIYKVLYFLEIISCAIHAFIPRILKKDAFRGVLTILGGLILLLAIYLVTKKSSGWNDIGLAMMTVLLMGIWQILYIVLTGIDLRRCKKENPTKPYFNDDFYKKDE